MKTKVLTVTQVAARLNILPRTVSNICARENIGVMANPRLRLIDESDIPTIVAARRPLGNPIKRLPPAQQKKARKKLADNAAAITPEAASKRAKAAWRSKKAKGKNS